MSTFSNVIARNKSNLALSSAAIFLLGLAGFGLWGQGPEPEVQSEAQLQPETQPQSGAQSEPQSPQPEQAEGEVATTTSEPSVPTQATPESDGQQVASQDSASGSQQEAPQEQVVSVIAPKFDITRVDAGGQTLIAGQAAPKAQVEVLLNGDVIAVAQADPTGEFAVFVELPASAQAGVLSLRDSAQGLESDATIIVAPILPQDPEPVVVAQAAAPDVPSAEVIEEASEPVTRQAPDPQQEAPAQAVLMASEDGVTLLQPASPKVADQVALDAITYSDQGDVELVGRAPGDAVLRVYLDNEPVTTERTEEGGTWKSALPNVETGVYTLRVDEVDAAGAVKSRVETPFKREEPAKLASDTQVKLVTVQPGATLWAIARERYGQGELYVQVYEANKDQIRDPDLIYPGQVFDIPE
ncbi:Ig-like domain-containing protein [uncultured Lentibacter sp.]|uniref:LysM peptidoglycan-binding domain-containing protein n=1 Tax=uncultured Lentibacter sp. TaxID=1659309 RepID=UPI002605AC74|nr:Ig-like domain-containing protein [uncultured Lentibacter sp.]